MLWKIFEFTFGAKNFIKSKSFITTRPTNNYLPHLAQLALNSDSFLSKFKSKIAYFNEQFAEKSLKCCLLRQHTAIQWNQH